MNIVSAEINFNAYRSSQSVNSETMPTRVPISLATYNVIPLFSSSFTNFNSSLDGDLRKIPFCSKPANVFFQTQTACFWRPKFPFAYHSPVGALLFVSQQLEHTAHQPR